MQLQCTIRFFGRLLLIFSSFFAQDASPRVPGGSPRTPNRSVTSNVASVTPIPAGSKKIDPNMKGTFYFLGTKINLGKYLSLMSLFSITEILNCYLFGQCLDGCFFFCLPPHSCLLVAGATSEGVLANFFNSLLSKKTGSPGGPGGVGGSPGGGSAGGTGSNLPPSAKKSGMLKRSAHNLDWVVHHPV